MGFFLFIILLFVNIPIFKYLFSVIFKDMDEFKECMRFVFTPEIFSLFRREYLRDIASEFKVSIYFISCIAIIAIEYSIISGILKSIF